ncbi:diguanylate cyclase (GGDEF)-like protein [Allocatelliglobosispora scoriae]|uniref:Diguanylate cyclase (GGDEF)-like protein n=1 Tax=Allocatelliglobosispora scoriae TaxID=643052 RepID=A0A841BSU1_9ACTN|nr:diguanylate cyclase [Allocatelliglobosispora scoriae]MBB5870466.1 diguanylate cyclase (GGDEF)-like protein [Allocatelliglobosispora scoriae]
MTLRTRLTTAFLVVVLGPVLIGAIVMGTITTAISRDRADERLDLAAATVRNSIGALCGQLTAVAEAIAATPEADRPALADRFVLRGIASGVHVEPVDGLAEGLTTAESPPPPWADCSGRPSVEAGPAAYEAIAARVELVRADGTAVGTVWAARTVDEDFLQQLADATGVEITLLSGSGRSEQGVGRPTADPGAPLNPTPTAETVDLSEPGGDTEAMLKDPGAHAAAVIEAGMVTIDLGPADGSPLPLVLSVPNPGAAGRYAMLAAVVLATAAIAVLAALWLARTTTEPLVALAAAADRVADGDLGARVPVVGDDEVGRLAGAFNRMTGELQSYVEALTASRDQLRGHLGVLGDTLSSTHDLNRILQVILQTARHATGARAGIVLLADPATGTLLGQCTEGLPDADPVRVPIGEGLLGSVAATGSPVRGRIDRDGPMLRAGEPECRTYVVVPFAAVPSPPPVATAFSGGDGVLRGGSPLWPAGLPAASGVLALYDRIGRDEFDAGDLDTLRTFAGQAAVAVDNVRVHEEAQRLSVTDPLTGLFNYRSLRDCIRREVERAHRFGRRLSVLALDLDKFKEINDSYGHAAGDVVLAEFARRIRHEIREVDLAFRHGGEEFVVLLPETDAVGGSTVAERLCTALRAAPIVVPARGPEGEPITVEVTVSIGVAVYPDHGVTSSAVLAAADDALYSAKAAGRNTHRVARDAEEEIPTSYFTADTAASGVAGGTHTPRQGPGR